MGRLIRAILFGGLAAGVAAWIAWIADASKVEQTAIGFAAGGVVLICYLALTRGPVGERRS